MGARGSRHTFLGGIICSESYRAPTRGVLGMVGHVILLNGASSSGKSSIAIELQKQLPLPFWHISIDHLRDAGVLPMDRIRSGEFDWANLRESFFIGFENSLRSYADSGNNLIVEYILEGPSQAKRFYQNIGSIDIFSVGVHCPLEELERREISRGDRKIGDAKRDFGIVHRYNSYDFEVDSLQPPVANAALITTAWRAAHP